MKIQVSGIDIDVHKKDIKNIHLAVYPPDGHVKISSPQHIEDERLRLFAISRLAWIKKQRKKLRAQKRQPERDFIQGESHYFRGKRYLLNVLKSDERPHVDIHRKKYINLHIKPAYDKVHRARIMKEWYRADLKKRAEPFIDKWLGEINVDLNAWNVRKMKTKWGSCNADAGRILLNLELAKKSDSSLEYVIVHELIHLKERLHTDRFVALLDHYLPDWRERRQELNAIVY